MSSRNTWFDSVKALGTAALVVGALAGCDGALLDVEDPDNVSPAEELSPGSAANRFAGALDDFREAYDDYVLYTGLHTDEFILAGTFPTRIEVDARRPISNNTSINGDVWQPLSVSRATADAMVSDFQGALGDEGFDDAFLRRGIGWGMLMGGYDRIFFAEFFCQSIFGGQDDLPQFADEDAESSPSTSTERMQEAVDLLASAETFANNNSFDDDDAIATAARIGQARAHMFLGNYGTAAGLVEDIPTDFALSVDFSDATPGEKNEVFQSTWGVDANIRWTVGNGTDGSRGNEDWSHRVEWLDQGLLLPPDEASDMDLEAFNGRSPVLPQTLYGTQSGQRQDAPIVLASGWEARMIEAEARLRGQHPSGGGALVAEANVNALLDNDDQGPAGNPMIHEVEPELESHVEAFATVNFGDEPLFGDLVDLARARAAGIWLTGARQGYLRRLASEFGDRTVGGLFPDRSDVNSISLPVPNDEIDNNQNISSVCPSGLP